MFKNRGAWMGVGLGAWLLAGCSSSTSETPNEEDKLRESLAALSVTMSDVAEEGGERMVNPVTLLTGELRDNWVYHLNFDFELKTGDKGTKSLDAQFTDDGKAIPIPTALNDNPILNLDVLFSGTFKGQPVSLTADLRVLSPSSRVVGLEGTGALQFADLSAQVNTTGLTINFNLSPIPLGVIALNLSQPDFGDWTGSATFQGTPEVHVVATNGTRTFDLRINLLTGEIH